MDYDENRMSDQIEGGLHSQRVQEEEIAKIINESSCIEEAVKFSNANPLNDGAYLAFLAGAYFITKHLKDIGKL